MFLYAEDFFILQKMVKPILIDIADVAIAKLERKNEDRCNCFFIVFPRFRIRRRR